MTTKSITIRCDVEAKLVDFMGSDESVVAAARVSTIGVGSEEYRTTPASESSGLIKFLIRNRHGTPFEHNAFTFFVTAPIFVFREFHRHRIGFSYNEESGRYKQLDPVFYVPGADRPGLKQVPGAKPGEYVYEDATDEELLWLVNDLSEGYIDAYRRYEERIERGFAKEIARAGLPVALFSSMWCTCNARSLMSFLTLRTKHTAEEAMFPSKPQHEINMVATLMEDAFAEVMPLTYDAYVLNKRVAP